MHVQHIEECPDIGPICATEPQTPYQHDQNLFSTDLTLDADVGLRDHFSLEVIAGARQVTDRIRFLDLDGNSYAPPVPDFHHRNETLVGPTDPWLMLHTGWGFEGWTFEAKAGVTIPIGATVENPFELGREGLPHQHVQFGTGTWDPVAGASVARSMGSWSLSAWTLNRLTLATNTHGYQSGHKLLAGIQGVTGFGLQRWRFTGGLDIFRETPERWGGVIEEEGNLGRTDLIVDVSAAWSFAKTWSLSVGAKIPVFTDASGEQTTYPAIVNLGIATSLSAASTNAQ